MKNRIVILLGLALVFAFMLAACSGADQSTDPEELGPAEGAVAEEPAVSEAVEGAVAEESAEEETAPKVSVTLNSTVHSSDSGGYAWLQEFLGSNDEEAADRKWWSESARAGAVCYPSIAPSIKSAPSAIDGSFSFTFEAEPGSTFRIMCEPDDVHPGGLGTELFSVPATGGTIDHDTAGLFSSGMWTPELGIANDLAAKEAGFPDAKEMFQSAGTCRVLALPGDGATIAVSSGDAYGFYMEAPDTASRVTKLAEPSGAYIIIKEFRGSADEADVQIHFTDASGADLTWPTATCPIKKGFSTDLVVPPGEEVAPDFTLPDGNGNLVSLADELQENRHVVLVFYFGTNCAPCMAQLREIAADRAKYEELDAQVIAIAAQTEGGAELSADNSGAQFPILADTDRAVARAYGVEDGSFSTPSVFVINQDGQITWKHVMYIPLALGCGTERVSSEVILENLAATSG